MTALHPWQWALLAATALAVAELLTGASVAISLALGCLAVALTELASGGAALLRDAAAFALTAAAAAFVLRRIFARHGDSRPAQGDVNDY